MGLDGCGKEFETWIDHSGLWREDSTFQKVKTSQHIERDMDFGVRFFGMRKSLWYIMYGLHVRWEGDVGYYIYDLHGVVSISICLEHYEEEGNVSLDERKSGCVFSAHVNKIECRRLECRCLEHIRRVKYTLLPTAHP